MVCVLGQCFTVPEALAKLSEEFGYRVTDDVLRGKLRRAGRWLPAEHLAKSRYTGAEPPDFEDAVTEPGRYIENSAPIAEVSRRDTEPVLREPDGESLRVFIIPDVHAPYHDERAFDAALLGGRRWLEQVPSERRVVLIQGDYLDGFPISFHPKTPGRGQNLEAEVATCNELLDRVCHLDAARVVYTEGNHENRLARYLVDKAPALFGLVSMRDLLRTAERGIEWVPYREHAFIGDALCTHELGFVGKYAAMRTGEAAGCSTLTGHTHRIAVCEHADIHGRPMVSASFGWLGDANQVDYMHRSKATREWAHGFGTGIVDSKGKLHVYAHRITEGRTVVDGLEIAA